MVQRTVFGRWNFRTVDKGQFTEVRRVMFAAAPSIRFNKYSSSCQH